MSEELLETAAKALGPLLDEVVFLGGASIHLWLTDPAAPATRATDDVDVIVAITTLTDYYRLGKRLRERGFIEDSDSRVICRWLHRETELTLDMMPEDENVLGFSNPWYAHTIETAIERDLPSGMTIRAATPPSIIATKLAAWRGRGNNDMLRSLDLHDILVLINGRPELQQELDAQDPDIQKYIRREIAALTTNNYFDYLIESALHGYGPLATSRAQQLKQQIDRIIAAS